MNKLITILALLLSVTFFSCEKEVFTAPETPEWLIMDKWTGVLHVEKKPLEKALISCNRSYPIGGQHIISIKGLDSCFPGGVSTQCAIIGDYDSVENSNFFYIWRITSQTTDNCTYFVHSEYPNRPDLYISQNFLDYYKPTITRLKVRQRGSRFYIYDQSNTLSMW